MPTITINVNTHVALKKAAEKRGTGVGALAENLLLSGIAKRDRDLERVKTKPKPRSVAGTAFDGE